MDNKIPFPRVRSTDEPKRPEPVQRATSAITSAVCRCAGLLATIIMMHFLVVRPLVQQLAKMQAATPVAKYDHAALDGVGHDIQQTNDLLLLLKSQREQLTGVRETVKQLQGLRQDLEVEAARFPEAAAAVKRMAELPDLIQETETQRTTALANLPPIPYEIDPPSEEILVPTPADYLDLPKHNLAARNDLPVISQSRPGNAIPEVVLMEKDWTMQIRPAALLQRMAGVPNDGARMDVPAAPGSLIMSDLGPENPTIQ